MENIILTNNKDLRLVGVKVGVLSTLRFELPLVSASATHVEVIVTSGNVHSAYTATFIPDTKRWQCDIAASQFPAVGKQSYEVAYVLDGKQFWDGKGWIEIEDATTSGIEPQPRPEPYRYAVVSVNGYGADAQGAVRIPKTFISANSPATTEGYMEGDIYFNRETGATWTLCDVQGSLTWVFNYKNYYTKAETEEAIDRVAAYYITYDAAGNPFPTYAALANAQTVYSGGQVRTPTRNDYCVVLADETHDNAEYRYIYAVAEGQTTGSWQPQFPVEGVMTVDPTVTRNSQNPVSGGGVWSAIWGALTALPTGFSSLYDWCVAQLAGKATKADATLTKRFSEWTVVPSELETEPTIAEWTADGWIIKGEDSGVVFTLVPKGDADSTSLSWTSPDEALANITATRTALQGYQLGSQTDKPLASEAEAEALRTGKLDKSGGTVTGDISMPTGQLDAGDVQTHSYFDFNKPNESPKYLDSPENSGKALTNADIQDSSSALGAALDGKANRAANPTAGNLAALDADGNPTDSTIPAANVALKADLRYALTSKTISNGAVSLDDRAINAVAVSSSLASLTVNFPTATSGKARDFGLRLTVASGVTTAPQIVLPQGVVCENADGEAPEIGADGAATILYFTETAANVFLVKGEVVTAIS